MADLYVSGIPNYLYLNLANQAGQEGHTIEDEALARLTRWFEAGRAEQFDWDAVIAERRALRQAADRSRLGRAIRWAERFGIASRKLTARIIASIRS